MSASTSPERNTKRLLIAFATVIFLWFGYTVIQTMAVVGAISQEWSAAMGFLPGILGVAVLLSAGLTREDCYLVANPISKLGFIVLVVIFVFYRNLQLIQILLIFLS